MTDDLKQLHEAPETIYLQVDPDGESACDSIDGATWCSDKINSTDICYVRADQLAAAQARIDELMLEYCPDEMTREQLDNWAKHQVPVGAEGMSGNLKQHLREAITMYSACLENPEKHMTLLSNTAYRIEQLEAECKSAYKIADHYRTKRDELLGAQELNRNAIQLAKQREAKLREQMTMLQSAIKNLRDVKGRHHSEIAYKRLIEALAVTEQKP